MNVISLFPWLFGIVPILVQLILSISFEENISLSIPCVGCHFVGLPLYPPNSILLNPTEVPKSSIISLFGATHKPLLRVSSARSCISLIWYSLLWIFDIE